jgi:hypothetical protein
MHGGRRRTRKKVFFLSKSQVKAISDLLDRKKQSIERELRAVRAHKKGTK